MYIYIRTYHFSVTNKKKNINFHRRNCQIPQNVLSNFIILSRKWHPLTGAAAASFTD